MTADRPISVNMHKMLFKWVKDLHLCYTSPRGDSVAMAEKSQWLPVQTFTPHVVTPPGGKVVQVPAGACLAGCLERVLDVFCAMLTIMLFDYE